MATKAPSPATRQQIRTPADFAISSSEGQWVPYRHLLLLNYYLLLLYTGKITRLVVTMPPQHGKSQLVAQYFLCWWLGWRPDDQIAIVCYAAAVAEKFGAWCRDHFAKWGPRLFGLSVDPKARSKKEWHVRGRRGVVRAVGVGGQLTSHRVDLGIVDDPIKGRKQANRADHREAQKVWFRDEFLSRLSKKARWIVVQTRWHEDDLAGWVETSFEDKIAVVHLPAIALAPEDLPEEERERYLPDPLGRQPGEPLCPELHPIEQLEEQRTLDNNGPNFWSLYQGIPRPGKGGIYDPKYWRHFGPGEFFLRWDPQREAFYYFSKQLRYDEVFLSVDCSYKDTDRSDKVAIGVFAIRGAQILLFEVLHKRLGLEDTCDAILAFRARYPMIGPTRVELKANGPRVINRLKGVVPGLLGFDPQGSTKVERAEATRYIVRAGDFLLPPVGRHYSVPQLPTSWVPLFKTELQGFPLGAEDDQVDMTTQAFFHFEERLAGSVKGSKLRARKNSISQLLR